MVRPFTFTRKSNGNVRDANDINELQSAIETIDAGGTSLGSTLDALSDVAITTPVSGQVVKYNGTNWVNDTDSTASAGTGVITVQAAAPGSPIANQLWLDTDDGTLYRRNAANTAWLPITSQGILNVKWFGAVGDGTTDDTAAIQAAIAYAAANTGQSWILYFPPTDYKVTSTLTWPSNIKQWTGSQAGRATGWPRLSWFGASGGTMISQSVGTTVHSSQFTNIAMRSGQDSAKAAKAIEFNDRLDSFCLIEDCSFSDFTGNPIRFLGGAINLHLKRFRCDGNGDHGIYFKVVGSCNVSITEITVDNNPSAGFTGGNGGAIHFDASAAADTSIVLFHIDNCNFEVQNNLTSQSTNAMVKLSNKPDTSARIMFYGDIESTFMLGAVSPVGNGNLSLRVTPASDNVALSITNCKLPGSIAGIPNFSYADAGIGSNGDISNLVIAPFSNYIGDFPSGTKSPAMTVVGEFNILQGPMRSHGQVMCRQWGVLPATLPAGTNVYDGEEFVDALALTTSSTSMVKVVCTDRGTTGTLSGVTGSGSSGASVITVNSVANLRKGQMITIAGTSATEYTIRDINATTLVLTLSTTLSATVSGAAVAFKAPTYRQYTQGSMTAYP